MRAHVFLREGMERVFTRLQNHLGGLERETSPGGCSLPQRRQGGRRSICESKEEAAEAKPWMACEACPQESVLSEQSRTDDEPLTERCSREQSRPDGGPPMLAMDGVLGGPEGEAPL